MKYAWKQREMVKSHKNKFKLELHEKIRIFLQDKYFFKSQMHFYGINNAVMKNQCQKIHTNSAYSFAVNM